MRNEHRSRRRFLQLLAASAAAPSVLAACASDGGAPPAASGDVSAGKLADLPIGTLRFVTGAPFILGRDANGVYAMTSMCTHDACDIAARGRVSPTEIKCNCHGSTYDPNGAVTGGPATKPLQHYEVTVDAAGTLTIRGGNKVEAATRLKV
jgi:cytochrome b6-f complex iron-sulfur subunit